MKCHKILVLFVIQLAAVYSVCAGPDAVRESAERFYALFSGKLPQSIAVIENPPAKNVRIDLERLNLAQKSLQPLWVMGYQTKDIGKYADKNREYKADSLKALEEVETTTKLILDRFPSSSIDIPETDLTAKARDLLVQVEKYRKELVELGFVKDASEGS